MEKALRSISSASPGIFSPLSVNTKSCLRWNYKVRLYKPYENVLDGRWHFPEAVPAG